MKKIILCLILACSVITLHGKTWRIIGEALEADTTVLEQDAANPTQYKFIGKLKNKPFTVFDGVNSYIPVCGMNDPFDQLIDMEIQVDESQPPFRVSYVNSNHLYRIILTDGNSPKITIEKVTPFPNIYLVGGPVNTNNSNWLLRDAKELEKDSINPFVFYYKGFLRYNTFGEERGSIKFLTSKGSWNPAFHPTGTTNVPLAQASNMRLGGNDTKWFLPADGSGNGYYVIKLNTLDETITIEEFQYSNVDFPSFIYIAGDAMPCGWDNFSPEVMTPTNIFEGKYSWTGNVVPGEFKFLKDKGSWGSCYVSTVENQPIEYGIMYPIVYEFEYYHNGGNDFKFIIQEADKCVIDVDLISMKVTVTKESENSTGNLDTDDVFITASNGKIVMRSTSSTEKHYTVFAIDGRKVHNGSFINHAELALPKGYYIINVVGNDKKTIVKKLLL